jgi:hypothetical protein
MREETRDAGLERARICYGAAVLVAALGVGVAVVRFPGGFDWVYAVISRLGSHRHNPEGARWLAGGLLAATMLLWPVARHLDPGPGPWGARRLPALALRAGLVGGLLLAVEGLLALDLSRVGRKAHEVLALGTFLCLYAGVVSLLLQRGWQAGPGAWPALLVLLPLAAVGVSQLALYVGQRDLGWVNTAWREMGIPFWLSFAFWQWLAVAFLGLGLGLLLTPLRRWR